MTSFLRIIQIIHLLLKYNLINNFFIRTLRLLIPFYWFTPKKKLEVRLKDCIEDLGPIFIKIAQILSSRIDLLPREIVLELNKLQDRAKPFSSDKSIQILEKAYGQPIDKIFAFFDKEAIAAASIAQVHKATLFSGEEVAVKILRPNIQTAIKRDIQLLKSLTFILETFSQEARTLELNGAVLEIESTLNKELNLYVEAANCSQMKRNFKDSYDLHIPKVHWPYVKQNILVTEFVRGVKITDLDALKSNRVNLRKLAHKGVKIFLEQAFTHCFFHADMHPGNIFIDIRDPNNPRYILFDFGIMGTLSKKDQNYLAENCIAAIERNYKKIAELHIKSGWVPKGTRVDEFEGAVRAICEPIFALDLNNISVSDTLFNLLSTARKFGMKILPQLILLQKTLINLEGIGRQLDDKLSLYEISKEYFKGFIKEQTHPKNLIKHLRKNLPDVLANLKHKEEERVKEKYYPPYLPLFVTFIGIAGLFPEAIQFIEMNAKILLLTGIGFTSFHVLQKSR